MLSNKIYKHFFTELSKYFFLVLFTFSIIVWAVQAVNFLDLIVEDGHGVSVYLNYSLLNIPKILTKFIPLSFLIALFLTILKFDSESEFLILWTSGMNKMKVVNFFFKVSILVTILQLLFASLINPQFLNLSRSLIKSSNLDYVSTMIKSKQFNDTIEGLTIYVEEKNKNDILKNIFIRDDGHVLKSLENSKDSNNVTIYAKEGKIEQGINGNYLVLRNGTIQKENNQNEIVSINFIKTNMQLEGLQTKSIIMPKIQETSSKILIQTVMGIGTANWNGGLALERRVSGGSTESATFSDGVNYSSATNAFWSTDNFFSSDEYSIHPFPWQFLDSPNTTSQITVYVTVEMGNATGRIGHFGSGDHTNATALTLFEIGA